MKTPLLIGLILASSSALAVTGYQADVRQHGGIAGWDLPGKRGAYYVTITATLNHTLSSVYLVKCNLRSFYGDSVIDTMTQEYRFDYAQLSPTITFTGIVKAGYPNKNHVNLDCKLNGSVFPKSVNASLSAIAVDGLRQVQ